MDSDRILLIEPTTLYREIVASLAERHNVGVERVSSVARALDRLAVTRPWIIVTSQELPDLPGTSFIAALQSAPRYRAIPKVLLSANENFTTTLYPPRHVCLKNPELANTLDALFSEFSAARDNNKTDTEVIKGSRILLAEDTATLQMLYDNFLHLAGAVVTVASNGREAIELAASQPQDLILMDIEMPEIDGWTATKTLRDAGFSKPIVALSAHNTEEFAKEALDRGFDDNLVKPMPRNVLLRRVAGFLRAAQKVT